MHLAVIHRQLGGKNLETSVRILDHAINVVKDQNLNEILRRERNKYQPKLFGGYKYI